MTRFLSDGGRAGALPMRWKIGGIRLVVKKIFEPQKNKTRQAFAGRVWFRDDGSSVRRALQYFIGPLIDALAAGLRSDAHRRVYLGPNTQHEFS